MGDADMLFGFPRSFDQTGQTEISANPEIALCRPDNQLHCTFIKRRNAHFGTFQLVDDEGFKVVIIKRFDMC